MLLAFISITSGGPHFQLRETIRTTWLISCKPPSCEYRFFVDQPASKYTSEILQENATHGDMFFRDSCALMKRHPDNVHYGNSPPVKENTLENPDYHFRRMYKLDWKVCFLQYCMQHDKMAQYHVFVEDDSFVCTENLLHQLVLLHNSSLRQNHSFRAGTAMYDGFDDSSTLMTRDIATAFATHYLENGMNCSR